MDDGILWLTAASATSYAAALLVELALLGLALTTVRRRSREASSWLAAGAGGLVVATAWSFLSPMLSAVAGPDRLRHYLVS
jgi:hypothetical protein